MGIKEKAKELAKVILEQDKVCIITHCDADGITGAAIAKKFLERAGIKYELQVVKYLDLSFLNKNGFFWFIDLGNGAIEEIIKREINCVITDHHYANSHYEFSLNPFNFGIDGETHVSASALVYLVAKEYYRNADLAIVGAIGDLQDLKYSKLVGINREILMESNIKVKKDIRIYGRDRPLFQMLAYATNPFIPGLFKKERNAIAFLKEIGVDYKKKWMECSKEEKRGILSAVIKRLLDCGFSYNYISRIFGEVYELDGNDVRKFSTLLNSMAKYGYGKEAIEACFNKNFQEKLLEIHKKRLKNYMEFAKRRLEEYNTFFFFHAGSYISDTMLGTVAGMLLKEEDFPSPIIAFTENEKGIKVSARAPYSLANKGLNLSTAIKKIASKLGGEGGGHRCAAGAIIPKGKEKDFLRFFDAELKYQLTL